MKVIILLFLVLIKNTVTYADLTHYFKKLTPQEKIGNHSIKGVDFIYTINLDQRPEKFATCTTQLTPYGIYPYRFSAVNGQELPLKTITELGVQYDQSMRKDLWGTCYLLDNKGKWHHEIIHVQNRHYFTHYMARGPIGIVLSHLSVLYDAYTSGYERIWVMEDDIDIIQNPHLISSLIDKLDQLIGKDGWDILFTDKDTKDRNGNRVSCFSYAPRPNFTPSNEERFAFKEQISPDFTKMGARYGTYSMIIQRAAMKKILDFFNQYNLFLPYDMDLFMPNNMNFFCVTEDVVSTDPQALSDNRTLNRIKHLF